MKRLKGWRSKLVFQRFSMGVIGGTVALYAIIAYEAWHRYLLDQPWSNHSHMQVNEPSLDPPSFAMCDFDIHRIDPECPRFVSVNFVSGQGLGDRFLQFLIGLVYALRTHAFLVKQDDPWQGDSPHGNYSWVPEFLQLNQESGNQTLDVVEARYPNLATVEHPFNLSKDFDERIRILKAKCNVLIRVDFADCVENSCYFGQAPHLYEEARHVLGCWFMHTDRANLPPLIYDTRWYNVFVHIRVGDIALLAEDKGGPTFFTNLKQELDVVLSTLFPVHYYFFAEVPANATTSESQITPPPPGFEFLSEIFQDQDEKGNVGGNEKDQRGSTQHLQRVSFISHMDAKATLYHQMNADMVITTGSSFPLVGVTVSPKPIVLFSRPKEGQHYPVYLRQDYALVENDGHISRPTLSQLRAQVITRYAEVHHGVVPYR